jgi:hypothetical protein
MKNGIPLGLEDSLMFHEQGIFLTLQTPHFQLVMQNLMHFELPLYVHGQFHHPITNEPRSHQEIL